MIRPAPALLVPFDRSASSESERTVLRSLFRAPSFGLCSQDIKHAADRPVGLECCVCSSSLLCLVDWFHSGPCSHHSNSALAGPSVYVSIYIHDNRPLPCISSLHSRTVHILSLSTVLISCLTRPHIHRPSSTSTAPSDPKVRHTDAATAYPYIRLTLFPLLQIMMFEDVNQMADEISQRCSLP